MVPAVTGAAESTALWSPVHPRPSAPARRVAGPWATRAEPARRPSQGPSCSPRPQVLARTRSSFLPGQVCHEKLGKEEKNCIRGTESGLSVLIPAPQPPEAPGANGSRRTLRSTVPLPGQAAVGDILSSPAQTLCLTPLEHRWVTRSESRHSGAPWREHGAAGRGAAAGRAA